MPARPPGRGAPAASPPAADAGPATDAASPADPAPTGPFGPYDAVILAGGRARRLGGVDKPGLVVGERPLIERVASAVAGAERLVVAGPRRPEPPAVYVREDPPGSGPVPALRAALPQVTSPWVALLAADLPYLRAAHVDGLRAAARGRDGALYVDGEGREQWLAGVWRTAPLRAALEAYAGGSLGGLLAPLEPARATALGAPWADCDTPADLAAARARA